MGVRRDDLGPEVLDRRDALADAARTGRWEGVFEALSGHEDWINAARPGSTSGFTPLHQAAWHGAGPAVVRRMLDAGAWRTLRTGDGRRPSDIARERGHHDLDVLLACDDLALPEPSVTLDLQTYLHALITVRTRRYGGERSTGLAQVEPLVELGRALWCPVPGMYGGFSLAWDDGTVLCESWCRVVGGSGQRHRITVDGIELLEDGIC